MPIYGYRCENYACQNEFEIEQRMTDDSLTECPKCNCKTLVKKIYAPMVFSKSEPTTVGHQAARNTEKMGHYEYDDKVAERKSRIRKASDKMLEEVKGKAIEHSGELPWWRSGKVDGLKREERPIKPKKAQEIVKELDIKQTEPRHKPKKKKA